MCLDRTRPALTGLSSELTAIGDRWRDFAVLGAQLCKGRENGAEVYGRLADMLRDCATREEKLFRGLRAAL